MFFCTFARFVYVRCKTGLYEYAVKHMCELLYCKTGLYNILFVAKACVSVIVIISAIKRHNYREFFISVFFGTAWVRAIW